MEAEPQPALRPPTREICASPGWSSSGRFPSTVFTCTATRAPTACSSRTLTSGFELRDVEGPAGCTGCDADRYVGTPDLKVWVANIRCSEARDDDDVPGLRAFFDKLHRYYSDERSRSTTTKALVLNGNDWAGRAPWIRDQLSVFFEPGDVKVLNGPECTLSTAREAMSSEPEWDLTYVQVHSTWTRHDLEEGALSATELRKVASSRIVINHGCSGANWLCNASCKDEGPNLSMSWIFGPGSGQAVLGQVRWSNARFFL